MTIIVYILYRSIKRPDAIQDGDDEMNAKAIEQMKSHGVDVAKYPFASFCFGRGWKGHTTAELARKAANRDASRCVKLHGGGQPQHMVADTKTGKIV